MNAGNEEVKVEKNVQNQDSKKKIVPNWLLEVFAWIKRKEMANSSLSTSCWTFKQLCWPKLHGKVKPFKIKWMEFWPERNESGYVRAKLLLQKVEKDAEEYIVPDIESAPIAQIPPPDYIIGFEQIAIHCLDAQILQFLEIIRPLLKDIYLMLEMNVCAWTMEHLGEELALMHNFLAILNDKIFGINFGYCRFYQVNFTFPGFLDQIQFIVSYQYQYEIDHILQWLSSQNNYQKMLEIHLMEHQKFEFIGRIMQNFSSATQPSNYVLIPYFYGNLAEFTLENERTGEILTLYHKRNPVIENDKTMYPFIARHPKGEEHWKEQGEQKYWPLLCEPYSNRIFLDILPQSMGKGTQNREEKKSKVKTAEERVNYAAILILLFLLFAVILFNSSSICNGIMRII